MHPIASYTERWPFNQQRVDLYETEVRTRFERRWGARAERVFPLEDLQRQSDHYSAKDYAWAKVYSVVILVFVLVNLVALAAWNFNTPFSAWGALSVTLFWVVLAAAAACIVLAIALAPRIEHTCFLRRAGGDGFWIGKRGPNRGEYETFVAVVREHIGNAVKAA
jgi:hypothetical protein